MGEMVCAALRDVDRHVAEDPHAALRGVGAQRLPFALEPHLVRHRAPVVEPVVEPVRVARPERVQLVLGHARVGIGEDAGRSGKGRRRHVGRTGQAFGRPEGQHLPP